VAAALDSVAAAALDSAEAVPGSAVEVLGLVEAVPDSAAPGGAVEAG
jgi:hypothetical protein